eukprot:NODE_587_length_1459_cov_349.964387.p1 GENE.NODE_587_length_1459_cov_349.964387~~NODE_587_length_1459_cov_349.964387.p1  ORF type:complete len:372 (+),score=83.12 NODE_587_length_1459_cov_349.964387:3-1118(+)
MGEAISAWGVDAQVCIAVRQVAALQAVPMLVSWPMVVVNIVYGLALCQVAQHEMDLAACWGEAPSSIPQPPSQRPAPARPSEKRRAQGGETASVPALCPTLDEAVDVDACEAAVLQLGANEQHSDMVARLCTDFKLLAFDPRGCRVAQAALDAARHEVQVELAMELRGHVLEAIDSPHANYCLQKVIEVLPPSAVGFIIEELMGAASRVAKHRYGIRILCRLLEHCPPKQIECLFAEVLREAAALCKERYGHYVALHILEYGSDAQRASVVRALLSDPFDFARHSNGRTLVEASLLRTELQEGRMLLRALVSDANALVSLACSRHGCFIAKALLRLPAAESAKARWILVQASESLEASKHGRRVVAAMATI